MKKNILAAFIALLAASAPAQQIEQVTIGDNFNYGLTYSLPKTVLQFTVKARCTKTIAGRYAMYAEKFMGLQDVALTDQTLYEISNIRMESQEQADATRTYHISFSEKGALPTFYLTEQHTLWAINQKPELPEPEMPALLDPGKTLQYRPTDVMTSEMLKAGSKSKQAELIAQEIFSIRESRSELIRGEADNVPNDGKQLQLMLDNLAAQEEALMSFFVGTTTTTETSRTFTYVPDEAVDRQLLFRFSSELGFVDDDDLAGSPYYISVSVLEDNRMEEMDPKAKKKLEKGIAFCVPGKVQIKVFTPAIQLCQGDVSVAQFGHVEQLPQAQFTDKKKPCSALFVPSTGAIRLFDQSAL